MWFEENPFENPLLQNRKWVFKVTFQECGLCMNKTLMSDTKHTKSNPTILILWGV